MASKSTRSAETRKLIVGMTLVGHGRSFFYTSKGERREDVLGPTLSYFPDGQQLLSGSRDKTTRRWDLKAGKEIEEARVVCEQGVGAVGVSSDGRWVITAGEALRSEPFVPGGLKAYEVKKGLVKTFEGHSNGIACIDISIDSKLLASGAWDGTARTWSLDTGELVAGPFEGVQGASAVDAVDAVRFSRDLRKLAVKLGNCLDVWDIQAQKLDNRVLGNSFGLLLSHVPVFWTAKDRTIVAAFCFTDGHNDYANVIYEFDSSTLETVGTPFEGHTQQVTGLALSNDSTLLAGASLDSTIKLWAFESRQLTLLPATLSSHQTRAN
jgi:WD40 repeat protein